MAQSNDPAPAVAAKMPAAETPAAAAAGTVTVAAQASAPPAADTVKIEVVADAAPIRLSAFDPVTIGPLPKAAEMSSTLFGEPITFSRPVPVAKPAASPLRRHAPLAAAVTLALALGALLGAAAIAGFSGKVTEAVTQPATADDTRALGDMVQRLNGELAKIKTGVDTVYRTTSAQLGKLADRLDRAEKANVEPASKLAKIAESIDRLEKHQPRAVAAAAPAPEVTGTVSTVEKEQARPPLVEGWRLIDFYDGRALVESRNGALYEVGTGSTIPGLGRVSAIKRDDGRLVVVTPKGLIAAASEPRRPSPYRAHR